MKADQKNEVDIESLPVQAQDRLRLIEDDIELKVKDLQLKQILFCQFMAEGGRSKTENARLAGYSHKSADARACILMRDVRIRKAIQSYTQKYSYLHGRGLPWMRDELEQLLVIAKDKRDVSGGNQCVRTLAELEGYIGNKGGSGAGNVTIQINTGLGGNTTTVKDITPTPAKPVPKTIDAEVVVVEEDKSYDFI